jgi:hypothetical protein
MSRQVDLAKFVQGTLLDGVKKGWVSNSLLLKWEGRVASCI